MELGLRPNTIDERVHFSRTLKLSILLLIVPTVPHTHTVTVEWEDSASLLMDNASSDPIITTDIQWHEHILILSYATESLGQVYL